MHDLWQASHEQRIQHLLSHFSRERIVWSILYCYNKLYDWIRRLIFISFAVSQVVLYKIKLWLFQLDQPTNHQPESERASPSVCPWSSIYIYIYIYIYIKSFVHEIAYIVSEDKNSGKWIQIISRIVDLMKQPSCQPVSLCHCPESRLYSTRVKIYDDDITSSKNRQISYPSIA